jgi:hypothetical protein
MLLAIILASVPGVLLGGYMLLSCWRRRRTPPELRGDWWEHFERQFRAYAASGTGWNVDPDAQFKHSPGDRRPPPR